MKQMKQFYNNVVFAHSGFLSYCLLFWSLWNLSSKRLEPSEEIDLGREKD